MLTIQFVDDLTAELKRKVLDGLNQQAAHKKNLAPMAPFAFQAYENEVVIGCLSGFTIYGSAYVDLLYVEEAYRGQSVGIQLIQHLEEWVRTQSIQFITLNTFDFEARPFYEKLGYRVEFERHGYDNQSTLYFMIKHLKT